MSNQDNNDICVFCKKGHVNYQVEEMRFRRGSDKGYIQCCATVSVGVCTHCGTRTLAPGTDEKLDAAFRSEYDKRSSG